jgi:5-methylcytosine-specific restriction endonuclease McrA
MSRYIPENLRLLVTNRANHRCEYCLMHDEDSFYKHQIDHIISLKHDGKTIEENLAYSCFPCNNEKGSDIGTMLLPERIFIRLFNPREDIWDDHFEMEDSVIYAKTVIGKATIKVLKLNDVDKIIERRILNE